jgi:hypothetical protein
MDQPAKRQREDSEHNNIDNEQHNEDQKEENNIDKEEDNKFLKALRNNRYTDQKRIKNLKEQLFIPLTNEQLIEEATKLIKMIVEVSVRTNAVSFSFNSERQYNKPLNLHNGLFKRYSILKPNIAILSNNADHKNAVSELLARFDLFQNTEIKRLAVIIANKIEFPFYESKEPLIIKVLKDGLHDPPYGVTVGKMNLEPAIKIWWGNDPK